MENYKVFFILFSIINTLNQKQEVNTDLVTRLINRDSKMITIPLSFLSQKKVKIIKDNSFDKKILSLNKSDFPYIVLKGLFNGNEGDLISSKSTKCPFYKKNKIPVSDYINYKLINNFDQINSIIENEVKNINSLQINISKLSFKITSLIIGNIILEIKNKQEIMSLEKSFTEILHDLSERPQLYSFFKKIKNIPTSENRNINKHMKNINTIFENIIKQKNNSLVLELMKYNSFKEVLNFLKFIFFAGFETTSNQLTFVMYMLSKNIKWQQSIINEIENSPKNYNFSTFKYLNSFIYETFRYHPIVNTSTRESKKCIYIFNAKKINTLNKKDKFLPERYLNKTPEIYTFQSGERQCIGKRLSILEIQLFIFHFLNKFMIISNNKPKIAYSLTKFLSPCLKILVKKRDTKITKNIDYIQEKKINNIEVFYKNNKYNLSEYVFKHPGGKYIIKSLHNLQIDEEFDSKHFNSKNAIQILEKYKNYQPNPDMFILHNILKSEWFEIDDHFTLVKIYFDNLCDKNTLLKCGNTVVFHQINGFKTRCFSISNINSEKKMFTLFVKKLDKGIFSSNLEKIKTEFVFSFIPSIYSNIKKGDILISIGSGIAPFLSFTNCCNTIAGFRGDYQSKFELLGYKNIQFADSTKNNYVYNLIEKNNTFPETNIYICGNNNFINSLRKYNFKHLFFDNW